MGPKRGAYRQTLSDAAKSAVEGKQPEKNSVKKPSYQTLRRWRQSGKLNEQNLAHHGIQIKWRKGPAARMKDPSRPGHPTQNDIPPVSFVNAEAGTSADPDGADLDTGNSEVDRMSIANSECLSDDFNSSHISSVSSFCESNISQLSDDTDDGDDDDAKDPPDMSHILNSKLIGRDALNGPLHPNLSVTKFETMMMIIHLSMKHGMAGVFLEDMLSFINKVVGIPDALQSKHLFQKLFMFGSKSKIHFYCPNCMVYLGSEIKYADGVIDCGACDWTSTVSSRNDEFYFISLSMKEQMRDVLTRPNVKFVSKHRLENVVSDIMDGTMYKVYSRDGNILSNSDALTITMNTDGSPVFKSGPNSLWPVHFFINEIEPSQRYEVDNILLAGLWFGKTEANAQIFLKPFVEQLQELESGLVWKKPDGSIVSSPVYLLSCCCDSVARPKVQHLHQFNGAYGCGICLHPNTNFTVLEKVEGRSGLARGAAADTSNENNAELSEVYRRKKVMRYLRGTYDLRTNIDLREHMKLAAAASEIHGHIMGATGVSVLCELRYFNVVYGFVIDYLHNCLLGTVKRLAGLWFDSCNKGSKYYIGLSVGRIDSRLEEITLPKGFRPPRPMSDRSHWKANEWRSFLLYFSLPVLINILPTPYYNHFKKLVTSIYTLTKESMLHDEVDNAHCVLEDFVHEYQDLYGEMNMVYNVHITTHLAQVVSKMGPLWAYSAFPFESANGRLVKLVNGTKGVSTQIARKYQMTKNIPDLLRNGYKVREDILDFCCNIIGYKYVKNSCKGENSETLLGRQHYLSLSDGQKQAFVDKSLPAPRTVLVVNRAVVGGKLFHSRLTTRQRKACDSCVRLISGEFALIDLIMLDHHKDNTNFTEVSFLVTKLNIATDPSPFMVSHIKQCSLNPFGDIALIKSTDISRKCIFYCCSDRYFVCEVTNFYETD